jgi:hypothetical protein
MHITKTLIRLAMLWAVCLPACSSAHEEAPLADGLQLQYEWDLGGEVVTFDIAIRKDGEEHFLLDITAEGGEGESGKHTMRVDRCFRTEEGELASMAGHPLWLPPSMREPGAEVVADGSIAMRRKGKTWEAWKVLVADGGVMLGTVEWYYEYKTGFFVGSHVESMGSAMRVKLVGTNVPGLKAAPRSFSG